MNGVKRIKKKLKKEIEEIAASSDIASPQETIEPQVISMKEDKISRDIQMFKDWLLGQTYNEIAEKYSLNRHSVWLISKKYNWKNLKKELRSRQFNDAIDRVKDFTIFVQDAQEWDTRNMVKKAKEEGRSFTKEERDHLRALYDRTLKEIRLDEGKPTELATGPIQVEIVLPPGAKRFGLIPPDPKTKITESDKIESSVIDLSKIEEEIKEEIE